jgi:hypothetical protein
MSNRITQADLENAVNRLNAVAQTPMNYRNKETNKLNIGNYHISYAYGGTSLVQTSNEFGGIRSINGGHVPKKELFRFIQAYIDGILSRQA